MGTARSVIKGRFRCPECGAVVSGIIYREHLRPVVYCTECDCGVMTEEHLMPSITRRVAGLLSWSASLPGRASSWTTWSTISLVAFSVGLALNCTWAVLWTFWILCAHVAWPIARWTVTWATCPVWVMLWLAWAGLGGVKDRLKKRKLTAYEPLSAPPVATDLEKEIDYYKQFIAAGLGIPADMLPDANDSGSWKVAAERRVAALANVIGAALKSTMAPLLGRPEDDHLVQCARAIVEQVMLSYQQRGAITEWGFNMTNGPLAFDIQFQMTRRPEPVGRIRLTVGGSTWSEHKMCGSDPVEIPEVYRFSIEFEDPNVPDDAKVALLDKTGRNVLINTTAGSAKRRFRQGPEGDYLLRESKVMVQIRRPGWHNLQAILDLSERNSTHFVARLQKDTAHQSEESHKGLWSVVEISGKELQSTSSAQQDLFIRSQAIGGTITANVSHKDWSGGFTTVRCRLIDVTMTHAIVMAPPGVDISALDIDLVRDTNLGSESELLLPVNSNAYRLKWEYVHHVDVNRLMWGLRNGILVEDANLMGNADCIFKDPSGPCWLYGQVEGVTTDRDKQPIHVVGSSTPIRYDVGGRAQVRFHVKGLGQYGQLVTHQSIRPEDIYIFGPSEGP